MASSTANRAATATGRRGTAPRRSGADAGSKARRPRKRPLSVRAGSWLLRHPIVAGVLCTALIAGAVVLVFWFANFSGLSSSADFVYSKF